MDTTRGLSLRSPAGWSDKDAATYLALALEGNALQVLLDLAPAEEWKLQALTIALERQFGQRCSTDQSREQLAKSHLEGESLGTCCTLGLK